MHRVITRTVPEIILIGADELSKMDLLILVHEHKTDRSEFVLCESGREKILVNRSLEFTDEIIPLIDRIMNQRYLDKGGTEDMFDKFSSIAGRKAEETLFRIWSDWRKKRIEADTKEFAEHELSRIRKRRLKNHLMDRKETARMLFSIGFGLYDQECSCDFGKGSENAFLYGYLCCMDDIEDHRIKGFCKECG